MKYSGINQTKYVQDLYAKNYQALMKEMKENLNNRSISDIYG